MKYCDGLSMAVDWGQERVLHLDLPRGFVRRVASYFLPYWKQALVAVGCIAVAAALALVPALMLKRLIDYLTNGGGSFQYVLITLAVWFGASVAAAGIEALESFLTHRIGQGVLYDLRSQLFARLLDQPISFFTKARSGDVISRVTNDVSGVEHVVSDTMFGVVTNVLVLVSTVVVMFALDWRLTLVALVGLPIAILPTKRVGRAVFEARKATQEEVGRMSAYLHEVLGISGVQLVKAFVRQRAERKRLDEHADRVRKLEIKANAIGLWFGFLMDVLATAGPAVLWLFGGYLVISGRSSVGTVVTIATVLTVRLYTGVASLGNMHVNVVGSFALFQRLFEYLDRTPEIEERPDAVVLRGAAGSISFDEVTFAYSGTRRPALDGISFDVEPGQLVALVGPSGAGKTTVTNLIPRFYDPQAGSVRIDGHDVRDLTLESLGEHIGIVFQDTFLFHETIRENLLYARPDATEDEIVAAARAAHAHDFVAGLPDGYETVVGERGHLLSGGEKQRLALARVILKDPRILILDEATSNLDSVSEALIQAALKEVLAGRTSVVIAHRLSTVQAADVILVFDQGRIVERGTHLQLLSADGLYATLYQRQFAQEDRVGALSASA